jgi:hypothetical protein
VAQRRFVEDEGEGVPALGGDALTLEHSPETQAALRERLLRSSYEMSKKDVEQFEIRITKHPA